MEVEENSMNQYMEGLIRISHRLSTAAAGYGHVYGVALGRTPRHTVKYACGVLRRAPCIHTRLRRLAMKPCEKCGLMVPVDESA